MSETTTFTPSFRNRSAQALPMPRAAPVMTATLPDTLLIQLEIIPTHFIKPPMSLSIHPS
jgi:hypothetical protein